MDRGERRDRTERKAKSRRRKLLDLVGVPDDWMRKYFSKNARFLDTEPEGKFRNNSIANEYANYGKPRKTNRKKAHSNYRSKGGYGVAMDWKPQDRRQIDSWSDDIKGEER